MDIRGIEGIRASLVTVEPIRQCLRNGNIVSKICVSPHGQDSPMTTPPTSLRFVPSEVEGLPFVTEAVLFPDRLELLSEGKWAVIRFLDIARWYRWEWVYRPSARLGFRVRGWPLVADRDWFHPPEGRFFRLYTTPQITVYTPDEPPDTSYGQTIFRRFQDVLLEGGFGTYDLG